MQEISPGKDSLRQFLGLWSSDTGWAMMQSKEWRDLLGFQPESSAPSDTRNTSGRRVWSRCRRINFKAYTAPLSANNLLWSLRIICVLFFFLQIRYKSERAHTVLLVQCFIQRTNNSDNATIIALIAIISWFLSAQDFSKGRALHVLNNLMLPPSLCDRYFYYSYFTDEETDLVRANTASACFILFEFH